MKSSQSRRACPEQAATAVAAQEGTALELSWTFLHDPQLCDCRLVNAVAGQVEQMKAEPEDSPIEFSATLAPGQFYFAKIRGLIAGEPGPWKTSNTIEAV